MTGRYWTAGTEEDTYLATTHGMPLVLYRYGDRWLVVVNGVRDEHFDADTLIEAVTKITMAIRLDWVR